jgi:HEAT repeat protein
LSSAAMGLAELKGVARGDPSLPEEIEETGASIPWDLDLRESILFKGEASYGSGQSNASVAKKRKVSAFYLEDETGRILIDPRGADFWDGSPDLFFESFRRIHLPSRVDTRSHLMVTASELRPGDPVYVVGSVELNPDALPGASDSERLVVRPRRKSSGLLGRVMLFENASLGADTQHVFLLSSGTESKLLAMLRTALRKTIFLLFVWLGASWWLVTERLPSANDDSLSYISERIEKRRIESHFDDVVRLSWDAKNKKIPASDALPAIIDLLEQGDERAMGLLHLVLPTTHERPAAAIPLLLMHLKSTDNERLGSTCRMLGMYGSAALPAVPGLISLLEHPRTSIRLEAIRALGQTGPDERAVVALARLLEDPTAGIRVAAVYSLYQMRKGAHSASAALTQSLDDPNTTVREYARKTLDGMGEPPQEPR